mmetsp:Transcript_8225/g.30387  ORF Transcript_8225/g.30387 Transcript_8225/m.30387 type:complete len:233 (+) Transcript_8225:3931-4629(+)
MCLCSSMQESDHRTVNSCLAIVHPPSFEEPPGFAIGFAHPCPMAQDAASVPRPAPAPVALLLPNFAVVRPSLHGILARVFSANSPVPPRELFAQPPTWIVLMQSVGQTVPLVWKDLQISVQILPPPFSLPQKSHESSFPSPAQVVAMTGQTASAVEFSFPQKIFRAPRLADAFPPVVMHSPPPSDSVAPEAWSEMLVSLSQVFGAPPQQSLTATSKNAPLQIESPSILEVAF